jgi:hypothetical protein
VIKEEIAHGDRFDMGPENTNEEDDLTWSIPYAGSKANLGKNASYAAARRGEIPTIRFGKKLRVPKAKFLRMLSGEPADVAYPKIVNDAGGLVANDVRGQQRKGSEKS